MKTICATDLLKLLAVRHGGDVFVPECKNGPSQLSGIRHQRLDAWALKKSYRHPLCVGYEIKVSRGDFLQDEKWQGYLPYCNKFYFVCPAKMIDPKEVPADAGLLWSSVNAARLYSKKEAPYRNVEIPESLYRYLLFSRTRVVGERDERQYCKEYWQDWMNKREIDADFGWRVSKAIREVVEKRITVVETESRNLKQQMKSYDAVQQLLRDLNMVGDDGHVCEWSAENRIRDLQKAVPPKLLRAIAAARCELESVHDALTALDKGETR